MEGRRIASFHLVKERPGRAVAALTRLGTDRVRLAREGGPSFWRLLGTGRGRDTGIGVDPRRTALFAVWEDDAALDRFLARSAIAARWRDADEAYTVRLRGGIGHGAWRGVALFDGIAPAQPTDDGDGPVAVLTRATVRARHWPAFVAAGRRVSGEVATAPGLLAVAGIGEAPLGRQATFSLWRTTTDAHAFAYGRPDHREAVRRTRAEGWYGEQLFARFQPYASTGTWDGCDPLALTHDR
jgi:heme-degrading monooxygenase HmoA